MSTRRADTRFDPREAESRHGGVSLARPIVCVVDADPAVGTNVRALLGLLGAEVRAFGTAAALFDALDTMEAAPVCIVADLVLPDLGGMQLMAELRRRGLDVPTILMSSDSDVTSAVSAMRAGALDFIEKPYIDRVLLNQIAPLLRNDDERP
jgi:two-component system response regulator FixJ